MNNSEFRPAILIPVYNHEHAIVNTLQQVMTYGHPVLLVDDGSHEPCAKVLATLASQNANQVSLLRLPINGGKGHAVKAGLRRLYQDGYTHGLQVDADGQHNLEDIPEFMRLGQQSPHTLIAGYPQYDDSISNGRFYGRYLTHIWVWINTLSFTIKDSMCGFRLYPVNEFTQLLETEPCGNRMDFDTEVIVRWLWRGGKIHNVHTKVNYPTDGVSHFKLFSDNVLISWMHTRLFFGMLIRLPRLLWQKL
ncbi:glycosyltransferase family 2 protein [Aliiglaciecola lipolytica]|uniref:Glycosyl transferase, group 2 family protein n=1 Tax=Aliiglaciecola lipolytica E3 TaxID=1127673 RepID=K6YP61_9ALTE|nr:glycosyltransferase family 2 protein [Aliiglaciecola lipolytica]GAC13130.1 glycosyl transferase, group 2 family protein [Aliiglaciecola lipolytica E3]